VTCLLMPFQVDPVSGLITKHQDVWDSLDNNQFPSPEAVALLVQQVCTASRQRQLCAHAFLHVLT